MLKLSPTGFPICGLEIFIKQLKVHWQKWACVLFFSILFYTFYILSIALYLYLVFTVKHFVKSAFENCYVNNVLT